MVLVGVSIGKKIALSKHYWCIVTVLDILQYTTIFVLFLISLSFYVSWDPNRFFLYLDE